MEENIVHDLGPENSFLDMTAEAISSERKKHKLKFIKINSFLLQEHYKVKRSPTKYKKMFVNNISNTGPASMYIFVYIY